MKTKRPTVRVILATDKKRDGMSPAQILVTWRGRAKENTGHWLKKEDEWHSIPDIRERVNDIEASIDWLMQQGEEFTASECLNRRHQRKKTLEDIARELEKQRKFSERTVINYKFAIKHWNDYFGDIPTERVTTSMLQGAAKNWLRTAKVGGVWQRLSTLKSLFNFGVEMGYLKNNPFQGWKFKSEGIRPPLNPKARSEDEINQIRAAWESGNEGAGWWLACYRFCGLALVDLLRFDLNNLEIVKGKYSPYYVGHINRQKTNQEAKVITKKDDESDKLINFILEEKAKYPKRNKRMWEKVINYQLSTLDFTPKLTYYHARHSYATELINKNVPLNDLATLLGRNIQNIQTYIKQVQSTEHLVEVLSVDDKIKVE
ncbi:MAG: phage integrase SAM-like domain-containing protein [Bacteroidales bacterium]|nr:phage integrase SAM-like domain-containing protein [Bacteroidales bacterium]